jgi:acyl-CoA reductase-like NAD-dependent aldehyde dehydrogenase
MRWREAATAVSWNIEPFINGRYRRSTSTECFDNINPATETTLCRVPVGNAADIDEAVRVARQRFNDGCWSELSPVRRAEVLMRVADLIVEHKVEFALLDCLEMGKPIQSAMYDAERFASALLRTWAGFANKLLGTTWNFPVVNAVYKLGPALAAGNTMVLKPSELAPSSALKLAELALEAGVPEGVLNVVPGLGSTVGVALAQHPDVDMVSFTGSTVTGRKIMEMCARSNGKPLLLECGGKNPQVVFADVANLDAVADATVQGVLWNQGQVCGAHTRLIAHENVKDALLEKVIHRASKYQPGDPLEESTNFGPLASPMQRDRVKRYIEEGLKGGAEAVLKGKIQETGGCYVSPTIFDRVESAMSIVQEEIFGPVLCVQTFKTEQEAIQLANGTPYGLGATVWTRDIGRGKRLAHAIRAGNLTIRTGGAEGPDSGCALSREPQKASGFGSEVGLRGLESYSTLKSIAFTGS